MKGFEDKQNLSALTFSLTGIRDRLQGETLMVTEPS